MTATKYYRIPGHESANAKIAIERFIFEGKEMGINAVRLFSYSTDVMGLRLAKGGLYELYINGLFSMTTRKHISWFCRIYPGTLTYYAIKMYLDERLLRSDNARNASIAESDQVIKIAQIVENRGKQIR